MFSNPRLDYLYSMLFNISRHDEKLIINTLESAKNNKKYGLRLDQAWNLNLQNEDDKVEHHMEDSPFSN